MLTAIAISPGLGGGFLFDDYPNIVDNSLVQPQHVTLSSLTAAALSSPSSDLKRPLSSLSFAMDYILDGGLDPAAMKCTNLIIHSINGLILYAIFLSLFNWRGKQSHSTWAVRLVAGGMTLAWLLAPINLTPALYVVQRMESLANVFVLVGLLGFIRARIRMLNDGRGLIAAIFWTTAPAALGVLAKETSILLPLYTLCLELFLFRFRTLDAHSLPDRRLVFFYAIALGLPIVGGVILLGPGLLDPQSWATRDFTLRTRLLSECRVMLSYLQWTVLPLPDDLNFYHDDFVPSAGWFRPITTFMSAAALCGITAGAWLIRRRAPLIGLGVAWFLACHTLTGTVLPLELIYEHRNYFASVGIILAIGEALVLASRKFTDTSYSAPIKQVPIFVAMSLLFWSAFITTTTARDWGNPLALAKELAERGADSPRAQYELGRAYIIASRYQVSSPYVRLAYAPLERASNLPGSSILPQQALIFLNSRIDQPVKANWWNSMVAKLTVRPPTIQDESSLDALSRCLTSGSCSFDPQRLNAAMCAALNHPAPTGRMLAIAASFATLGLRDEARAYALQTRAVSAAPKEPIYRITLAQMARERGDQGVFRAQLHALAHLNIGGRLDAQISALRPTSSTRL